MERWGRYDSRLRLRVEIGSSALLNCLAPCSLTRGFPPGFGAIFGEKEIDMLERWNPCCPDSICTAHSSANLPPCPLPLTRHALFPGMPADLESSGNPTERPLQPAGPGGGQTPSSKACSACGADLGTSKKACANCHLAFYCGKPCQVAHWKAGHKAVCQKQRAPAFGNPDETLDSRTLNPEP